MHPRIKKTLWYLLLTFGLSYGLAGLVLGLTPPELHPKILLPLSVVYMFMPMIAAWLVQKIGFHEPIQKPLGVSFRFNRWFVVAALVPPVLALASLGCSVWFPGVEFSWGMEDLYARVAKTLSPEKIELMRSQAAALPLHPFWIGLIQGVIAGASINAVAAFGEEMGWRGLLQKEMAFMGFWRSSLVVGLIWGLWHAPIILQGHNYPDHPHIGVFYMIYFTLLYAPLFAYVRARSGSVIACAIMHGTLNGTAGLSFMLLKGGNDLLTGLTGVAGFIILASANVALWVYDRWFAKKRLIPVFKTEMAE